MNYERPYSPVSHAPATAGTQLAPTRRYVRYAGTHCPHTYGVRVCSCTSFATEPCRPTACGRGWPQSPVIITHYTLLITHCSYTFSAKEKDVETGLSYFGSRYYSSDLSIWLSVDPMSAKYPSLSPYTYCADNPVRCVDPNGEDIGDYYNQYGTYLGTDCIDDGKIHIVDEQSWNNLYKDMFSFQMDNGTTYISSVMASDNPSCPNLFSQKPTNANLSDEAILNILQQYNTTGVDLQINNNAELLTTSSKSDDIVSLSANTNHWRHCSFLNDYFEIYSSFDNEIGHMKQHAELGHAIYQNLSPYQRECSAVAYQKSQAIFKCTSEFFKKHIDKYLNDMAKEDTIR